MEPNRTDDAYAPDDKGREHVHVMMDRELLEELVTTVRRVEDTVMSFLGSMQQHPMMKMMGTKLFGKS